MLSAADLEIIKRIQDRMRSNPDCTLTPEEIKVAMAFIEFRALEDLKRSAPSGFFHDDCRFNFLYGNNK